MIGRRGMLGALAGAPLASKALARSAMAGDATAGAQISGYANAVKGRALGTSLDTSRVKDRLKGLAQELADVDKSRGDRLSEARRSVTRLDPDIDAARSLSMSTKIRLQAERDVDRDIANHRGWLARQIDDMKREWGVA